MQLFLLVCSCRASWTWLSCSAVSNIHLLELVGHLVHTSWLTRSLRVSWLLKLLLRETLSLGLLRLSCGRIVHAGGEELRSSGLLETSTSLVITLLRSLRLGTSKPGRCTINLLNLRSGILTTT